SDMKLPSTVVCRAPAPGNICDAPEFCSGNDDPCPANQFRANGTPCSDGSVCTQTDACQNGTCVGGNPLPCDPCQMCDPAAGCAGPACTPTLTPTPSVTSTPTFTFTSTRTPSA